VKRTPDYIALTGPSLSEKRTGELLLQMTYEELQEISGNLADLLKRKGVKSDMIVSIHADRYVEVVAGILSILIAGGAYLPVDPDYPPERIDYMLKDSNAMWLLTPFELSGMIRNRHVDCQQSTTTRQRMVPSLAYIIYTSGTTGKPKGVLIEHSSVVNLAVSQVKYFNIDTHDRIMQFYSLCFDASMEQIFISLFSGAVLVLVNKPTVLEEIEFERFIARQSITHLDAVPSFLSFVNLKDSYELKRIIVGGDVCPVPLAKKWSRYCNFYNGYGPTETTVTSIEMKVRFEDIDEGLYCLPIGKPIANTRVFLLGKRIEMVPVGVPGELHIGGESLARGYLNRPELTAEKFGHDLSKKVPGKNHMTNGRSYKLLSITSLPHSPIYRTGDLARWLPDGNIEFLGRIDNQVKIRGYRVELGEIENRLLRYESIREAVVLVKEDEAKDKKLAAYFVSGREISLPGLREYLLKVLPDHMIPANFTRLAEMPRTATGKIDRNALPSPKIEAMGNYVMPRNPIEKKLANIWIEILGSKDQRSLEELRISINDNFFHLGGHSLKAITMASNIHKTFGVKIAIQDLFRFPTIAGMADLIARSNITTFEDIEKVPEQPYYEMSYSQKRLWLLYKMDPQSTAFNLPVKITLYEAVDESIIRGILEYWITRHESLRTFFTEINDEPVQVIKPVSQQVLDFEVKDWSHLEAAERENRHRRLLMEESAHIFNLGSGPLFRAKLIKWDEKEYDFIFNIHHIVSDGWSMEILRQEFQQLDHMHKKGMAVDMEPLRIQYKDYAAWHNRLLANEGKLGGAEEFWKDYLSGTLPVLNLPYDFSAGPGGKHNKKSSAYIFTIGRETTERLNSFAREQNGSLFMLLLASFNILLAHITGQEEILMAVPAAARQHWELKNIIGMFVNTLILRTQVNMKATFNDLFRDVQADTFNVLAYQDYPLELIFSRMKIKYPKISVFFNMVNVGISQEERLLDLSSYHIEEVQETKFDIHCYFTEYKNAIQVSCHYFRELFLPGTLERIMRLFSRVLENISRDPAKKAKDYCISGTKKNILGGLKTKLGEKEGKAGIRLNIKKEVKEAQQKLSKINIDFLDYVEKNPGCFKRSNFQRLELNDDLFRLQPWPTFISAERRAVFQEVGVRLFNLIKQIPARVFNYNLQKMSEYYMTPEKVLDLELGGVTEDHIRNLVSRGDFLITSTGMKCLEYNVTPSLGGWQVPIWESLYLKTPILARFFAEYDIKIKNENLLDLLLKHVIRSSLGSLGKRSSPESELNIALAIKEYEEGMTPANWMHSTATYLNQLYKEILHQMDKSLKGKLLLCNCEQLELLEGCLFYQGKKIHGLIECYTGKVSTQVMEAFKAGNLCLFNGPIINLMSNKMNLAILSDPRTNAVFTNEDRRIIDVYVPWTRKTNPGPTTFKGQTIHHLEHFMLSHQKDLVLKPGLGLGGQNIWVGNKTTPSQWEKYVKNALQERNWVVQEWVETSPGVYQAGDGYEYHDMVWGFFIFGSQYTGAWVRVIPQEKSKGVINCHQGASVSVIFEVDE